MKRIKRFIKEREFAKFFLMFFSGTLFAQLITIFVSPIITRIYTPKDFGMYSVYLSIVSLLIVFVTGRYEFAINSTKNEEDAITLFKVVNYLSVISSGVILIAIWLKGDIITETLSLNINKSLLFFIPFTLLLMGLLQSSNYYLNRQKKFQVLAKSKVYQSIVNGTSSISLGLMNFGAYGLIFSNILGVFISQLFQRIKGIKGVRYKVDLGRIKNNLKKYKQFPLYNAPSAFFDNLALQAPTFILVKFYSESIVGFYSLTVRVIGLPLGLISTSISQVFLSQVSELHRNNKSYKAVVIKLAKYLAAIGLVPLTIISLFGPLLFRWIFGEEWIEAGEYARILTIGYFFKFVVSPLSIVFFINQKVKLLSTIQIVRAITTMVLLIFFALNFNLKILLYAYTIHEVVFYLVYFYFIIKTSE